MDIFNQHSRMHVTTVVRVGLTSQRGAAVLRVVLPHTPCSRMGHQRRCFFSGKGQGRSPLDARPTPRSSGGSTRHPTSPGARSPSLRESGSYVLHTRRQAAFNLTDSSGCGEHPKGPDCGSPTPQGRFSRPPPTTRPPPPHRNSAQARGWENAQFVVD